MTTRVEMSWIWNAPQSEAETRVPAAKKPGVLVHLASLSISGTGLVLIPTVLRTRKTVGFAARLAPTILAMLRCPQLLQRRPLPVHARHRVP
jgi:hypothetical protein